MGADTRTGRRCRPSRTSRAHAGNRINSPIDGPASFFTASALRGRAATLDGLMDGIVTAQKTVAVAVDRLYDAFLDEALRARWLPEADLRVRTASAPRSARFDWGDGDTRVNVTFIAKGETKSTAALQHERLADAQEAERMKAFWRDGVAALKEQLEA